MVDTMDRQRVLETVVQHRAYVAEALGRVASLLITRAQLHDLSKLDPSEIEGFARINGTAREHPFGSEEYKAALRQEQPTIDAHYRRNGHHPECHDPSPLSSEVLCNITVAYEDMGLLDVIEMVCDWHGAWKSYEACKPAEKQTSWAENMVRQRSRYKGTFLDENWWLVEQVSFLLTGLPPVQWSAHMGHIANENNSGIADATLIRGCFTERRRYGGQGAERASVVQEQEEPHE